MKSISKRLVSLKAMQELSSRILTDETEDIPEVRKTFEILLKAS